jgi:dienelactone hydrolase
MTKRIVQRITDEREYRKGRRILLDFNVEGDAERIPAILLRPMGDQAVGGALLLHGYSSHKEQMSTSVGEVLLRHDMASLAIDLPLHGERSAGRDGVNQQAMRNPLQLVATWKLAQREIAVALGYLAAHPGIDRTRIGLIGYSMGSFLGVEAAATSPVVRALVLAAGGDLPTGTPFERIIRLVADPLRAVRRLNGKPLLMVHGRGDRTVSAEQAQRLYDAAEQPKELRWWNAGHHLPEAAIDDAATWMEQRFRGDRV